MNKPVNPVALVFWIVAAVFIVADVPIALGLQHLARLTREGNQPGLSDAFTLVSVWSETRSALLGGGQLIGIGVLIELVDQIRWNALPAEMRIARRPASAAVRRLRTIGLGTPSLDVE